MREPASIRTRSYSRCYLCGAAGRDLYAGLNDRGLGVGGRWDLRVCPDGACGLIWLDPQPVAEDIGKTYVGQYYTHAPAPARRSALQRFYDSIGPGSPRNLLGPVPRSGGTVLDVGCGNGDLLLRLRDLGWQVEGLDVDPRAVEVARARGLSVRQGDLVSLRYEEGKFDVVHLRHVIEHVLDPLQVLTECRRILRPGGRLIVITPNTRAWGHRRFQRDWYALEPPRHLHLFHVENLAVLVRRSGFQRCVTRSMSHDARTVLALSAMYRRYAGTWHEIQHHYGIRWSLTGVFLQTIEQLMSLVRGDAGEEALGLAWKDEAA